MADNSNIKVLVEIQDEEQSLEQIDEITRKILLECQELNIGTAQLVQYEQAHSIDKKGLDPVVVGTLLVAVVPIFLTKFLDLLQAWALRRESRVIKIKVQIGENSYYEVEVPASMPPSEFKNWANTVKENLGNEKRGKAK